MKRLYRKSRKGFVVVRVILSKQEARLLYALAEALYPYESFRGSCLLRDYARYIVRSEMASDLDQWEWMRDNYGPKFDLSRFEHLREALPHSR